MKIRIALIMVLLICLALTACGHTHVWQPATCTTTKICPECGETEGEALGHRWIEATCTTPKTCEVCLQTMGEPIEHLWADATCTELKHCQSCGKTEGELAEHKWLDATCTAPMTCEACGATEGEVIEHKWLDATCTAPMTCEACGATEGEMLAHNWQAATCTAPETCSDCTATQGEALGHNFKTWKITQAATCTEVGKESSKCTVCGETNERDTELAAHTPGKFTIDVEATPETEGTKVQKCIKCEKVLNTEKYSLSTSEIKKYYDKQYETISYDELARRPKEYEGKKVKFTGIVVQVCSEAQSILYYSTYRVATSGSYNNVVYILVDNYGSGSRILEDDRITFYGTFEGLYTYTTVRGDSITIPKVKVDHII